MLDDGAPIVGEPASRPLRRRRIRREAAEPVVVSTDAEAEAGAPPGEPDAPSPEPVTATRRRAKSHASLWKRRRPLSRLRLALRSSARREPGRRPKPSTNGSGTSLPEAASPAPATVDGTSPAEPKVAPARERDAQLPALRIERARHATSGARRGQGYGHADSGRSGVAHGDGRTTPHASAPGRKTEAPNGTETRQASPAAEIRRLRRARRRSSRPRRSAAPAPAPSKRLSAHVCREMPRRPGG